MAAKVLSNSDIRTVTQSTAAWRAVSVATTRCRRWGRGARWPTPASPARRTSACSRAAAATPPTTPSTPTPTSATTPLGQMGEIFVDVARTCSFL